MYIQIYLDRYLPEKNYNITGDESKIPAPKASLAYSLSYTGRIQVIIIG